MKVIFGQFFIHFVQKKLSCSQNLDKSLLWDIDRADGFHSFFTFFLFFKKFSLAGNIPTVAFGNHIFSHGTNTFPSYNLSTNRCLNSYLLKLNRDHLFELGCKSPPT